MPSGPDWRAQAQVLFGITGWFVLIFVVTAIGLYLLTSHLVQDALQEEWENIESVEFGGIDPSAFAPPAAVLTLIESRR